MDGGAFWLPVEEVLWSPSGLSYTSCFYARSPKFDPNKIKVIHLRCFSGETVSQVPWLSQPFAWMSPKEIGDDMAKTTGDLTSQDYSENDHSEQAGPDWGGIFCLSLNIKTLKNYPEMERSRKTISTMEIALLMRLPILPDRYSTNLWPENSLESLKRSWRLPSLWATMLMAATHMTSPMTLAVGQ